MAYKSQYEILGEELLKGKKIEEITLKGKTYKFNYSVDGFIDAALKSGWPLDIATEYAKKYDERKVEYLKEDDSVGRTSIQSMFISDMKSDFCLNSGGFGCVHGDTKIYTDKGDIPIKELYEKGVAPKVISKDGKWSYATVPVKYEKAQLFKVKFGDKEIIATAKHRFLTNRGWKQLSDLVVGEQLLGYVPYPQVSISDNVRSVLLSSVFHLFQRFLGSLSYCRSLFYSYGEQLLSGLSIYRGVVPSLGGVLGRSHQSYNMGVGYSSKEYNHAYQQSFHLSKSNSEIPSPFLLSRPVSNEVSYSGASIYEHTLLTSQSKLKYLWHFVSHLLKGLKYIYNLFVSYPYPTINANIVQSISYHTTDYYYDLHVFGTNNYLAEGVFHHNSGKSLALYIKLILFCKCFPGNRVLMGRKTLSDIDRAVLPELFDLMPATWYEHRVKDGLINFSNGSQIILFGLDAMQSGGVADIKKAEQKLKSLNLGAYFIDQLEEVEESVFDVLNSRLRRNDVPIRQGNMDCNPANFWAYDAFVANPREGYNLYESSMMYNPHLPWDYIRKQLAMDESYRRRFVFGEWTTDILLKGAVFAKEHISYLENMRRTPIVTEEGCEIYEQPGSDDYRMGVDPSEGIVDPSSISVVSSSGRKVAKFNGKVPITALADKVKYLYYKYKKPLIIPESNAAGAALIREIRDLKVYRRKQLEYKQDKETEKLGFRTSWETKQQLINHFQILLRDKVPKIYDKKTVEEMKTFLWNNDATQQGAGSARGFHDDDVMSTLLAFWDFNPVKVEEIRAVQSMPKQIRRFQYN